MPQAKDRVPAVEPVRQLQDQAPRRAIELQHIVIRLDNRPAVGRAADVGARADQWSGAERRNGIHLAASIGHVSATGRRDP